VAHALDLSGVRAKLDRTNEQAVFLDCQWRAFRDHANAYRVEFEEDPEPHCYIVRLKVFKPVPLRLSVIFGEIIHNLRSALDHLVCRLVEGYGGAAKHHHSFPIHTAEVDFIRDVLCRDKKRRPPSPLKGIPVGSDVWALIEGAQPYKRGNAAKDHPLYILNDFWNGDKHRVLNAAYTFPDIGDLIDAIDVGKGAFSLEIRELLGPSTPLEDGAKVVLFRFDPRGPQPDMQMKGPLPLGVAFGDGQGERSELGAAHAHIVNLSEACEQAFP